jgi:hypothetical protein
MSDENKPFDRFKPSQPRIPGVPAKGPLPAEPLPVVRAPNPDLKTKLSRVQLPPPWISAILVGAIAAGIAVAWWSSERTPKKAAPVPVEASAAPLVAEPPRPAEGLPVAPGEIATTDQLAKAWSSQRFIYRDPATALESPAIVVHLPGGAYWALSLREPYGTCELEYVTDLDKLESVYHYRANHPMVGDPCSRTLFDLTRYGTNPGGGLVRGAIAQGAGIRPPMAIEIRTKGKQVVALKME